jgi:hypothetical protein
MKTITKKVTKLVNELKGEEYTPKFVDESLLQVINSRTQSDIYEFLESKTDEELKEWVSKII